MEQTFSPQEIKRLAGFIDRNVKPVYDEPPTPDPENGPSADDVPYWTKTYENWSLGADGLLRDDETNVVYSAETGEIWNDDPYEFDPVHGKGVNEDKQNLYDKVVNPNDVANAVKATYTPRAAQHPGTLLNNAVKHLANAGVLPQELVGSELLYKTAEDEVDDEDVFNKWENSVDFVYDCLANLGFKISREESVKESIRSVMVGRSKKQR